ncbi:MAG: protein kinase [Pirellulales bacterium]
MSRRMACPDPRQLGQLARDELDGDTATALRAHISSCPTCAETMACRGSGETRRSTAARRGAEEVSQGVQLDEVPPVVPPIELPGRPDCLRRSAIANAPPFEQLGPYRIIREIGRGGMGVVYEAVHTKLDKPVALKVLPEDRLQREPLVQRFFREMKAIGRLDHPNIVRATDAGEAEGVHYLAMELVDGLDLSTVSKRIGPLSVADACELVRQAAVGLEYVHQQGSIHRDVKPSNLMVTPNGEVKILDLGLAVFAEARDELTGTGHTMGTADYMAPEQANDSRRVNHRADIYSLGCTLYRLLTGRAPYAEERYSTPLQIMMAHAQAPIPRIDQNRTDLPEDLIALLIQMLDKSPQHRPAAGDVARRLAPFVQGADLSRLVASCDVAEKQLDESEASRGTGAYLSSAMTETWPSVLVKPEPRSKRRSRRPVLSYAAIALGLLAAVVGMAMVPTIYRVVTNRGLLVVEVDKSIASKVTLELRGPENVTLNEENGFRIQLKAGEYQITPAGAADRFSLSEKSITLRRGGKELVKVHWKSDVDLADAARTRPAPPRQPVPKPTSVWQLGSREDVLPGLIPRPAKLPGIKRWQLETPFPRAAVHDAAWDRDGKWLACSSYQTVRIFEWEDQRLRLVQIFAANVGTVTKLDWNPHDDQLAVVGAKIQVWDVRRKQLGPVLKMGHLFAGWSPDGRWLTVGDRSGAVRLVASDGTKRAFAVLHGGQITSMAWSPGGQWLATASSDKTVRLWTADGQPGPVLTGPEADVASVGWTAEGDRVYCADKRRTIWQWKRTGELLRTTKGGESAFAKVELGPNCQTVATLDEKQEFKLWDVESGRLLLVLTPDPQIDRINRAQSWAWSSDGRWIATGDWQAKIQLWSTADGKAGPIFAAPSFIAKGHWSVVDTIAWNPNGKTLVVGSWDTTLRLWDVEAGKQLQVFPRELSYVNSASWSPDGNRLATAGYDQSVRVFAADSGEPLAMREGHQGPVHDIAWGPDSQRLVSAGDDGTTRIWNLENEKAERVIQPSTGAAFSVDWSSQGGQVVTGYADGSLRIWDLDSGTSETILEGHPDKVAAVRWSPNGRRIAGIIGGRVRIWAPFDGELPLELKIAGARVLSLDWDNDGGRLAGGTSGEIRVWDAKNGNSVDTKTAKAAYLAWSPDDRWIAYGGYETIMFLDVRDGGRRQLPNRHAFQQTSLAWSPDSRRLASTSVDSTLRVSNVATGEQLWGTVFLPDKQVATFSASGQLLFKTARADAELVYFVENEDGSVDTLSHDAFHTRFGQGTDTTENPPAVEPRRLGTWKPGPPQPDLQGLIPRPAQLSPIGRWQVETRVPRGIITGLAWSPTSNALAVGSTDGHIRIYDADDWSLDRLFGSPQGHHVNLAWSGNGRWLASCGGYGGGTPQIWSVNDSKRGAKLRVGPTSALDASWHPDNRRVATGANRVEIWDAIDGVRLKAFEKQPDRVRSIDWSPDGRWIASLNRKTATIQLWDADTGNKGPSSKTDRDSLGDGNSTKILAWSPNSQWIASPGKDVSVRIWDVTDGRTISLKAGKHFRIQCVTWSPDSQFVAAAAFDDAICIWEMATGKMVRVLNHAWWVNSVAWSPDGKRLASGSSDGTVVIWDVMTGDPITTIGSPKRHESSFVYASVAWDSNGRQLAVVGPDPAARVFDGKTATVKKVVATSEPAQYVTWHPNDGQLAWAAHGGPTHVHDLEANKTILTLDGPTQCSIAWSPDGRRIAFPIRRQQLRVVDARDGRVFWTQNVTPKEVMSIAWSPQGRWIATGDSSGKVRLWESADGSYGPIDEGYAAPVNRLGWSLDGRRLAAMNSRLNVSEWAIGQWHVGDGGRSIWQQAGLSDPIHAMAWDADARRLAVSGQRSQVVLLDGIRGTELLQIPVHRSGVESFAWSPDGGQLASVGFDDTLLVTNAANGQMRWLAVLLPEGQTAVFSAAGERLDRPSPSIDKHLVYVVEKPGGELELLTPAEFRERTGL